MNLNIYDINNFFTIILSGFMFVWSFRKISSSEKIMSDFEYLGFSAFWGFLILVLYYWLMRNQLDKFNQLVSNPFAAGFVLSIVGLFLGGLFGVIIGSIKNRFR
jgi:hypothetical protein